MALEPITREEKYLAKAAGQSVDVPEPITRKEMFLDAVAKSGGVSGGGGADLLDENGIIKQEYFPEGFPYKSGEDVVIMPSTTLTADPESGSFAIPGALNVTAGMRCKVHLADRNETWDVVCQELPENDMDCSLAMGNLSFMGMGDDTGEPFAIAVTPPEFVAEFGIGGVISAPLLAAESLTVSISGFKGTFATMDPDYLPAGCETIIVETSGEFGAEDFTATHTARQIHQLLNKGKNVVIDYRKDDIVYRYTLARRYDSGEQVFCCVDLMGAKISVRDLFTRPDFRNWKHTVVKADATYDTTE